MRMAVTVDSKGGAGGAPSYVKTPAWRFLASLPVDRRLARHDVAGSIAHVEMLGERGILTREEATALAKGLRRVWGEIEAGFRAALAGDAFEEAGDILETEIVGIGLLKNRIG